MTVFIRILITMIFFSIGLSLSDKAVATETLVLKEGKGKYILGQFFEYIEDKRGVYTLEDIISPKFEKMFIPSRVDAPNFGFTKSVFWVRLKIQNKLPQKEKLFIEINYPLLDQADLYFQNPDESFEIKTSGKLLPFSHRLIDYRNYLFPFIVSPGEKYTIYFKIKNTGPVQFPMALWTPSSLIEKVNKEIFILGIFYGLLIVMFLYNLFLFFAVKNTSYLYYVLYVTGYIFLMMSLNGLAFEYLWPNFTWWVSRSVPFFLYFTIFWILKFAASFLKTEENAPHIHKWFIYLRYASILGMVALPFIAYPTSIKLATLGVVFLAPTLIFAGGRCVLKGYRPARIFMIAWSVFIFGIMARALMSFGILPLTFFTEYGSHIGSAIEVILLSLGLADRINTERREKDIAQKQAIQAQQQALNSLQNADRLKNEFLSNTSHELRTPLNGIIGLTETLLEGAAGKLPEAAKENLSMVVSSSKRLANLVNDILDFSKLKHKSLNLNKQAVDIREATEIVLRLSTPLLSDKPVELKNDIPTDIPLAVADENRLQQILYNLIGNAIKFTDQGQIIVCAQKRDKWIEVFVTDTGIGIPKDKQKTIFNSFEQADGTTEREYGGTGLGLAVTKSLIDLHGGTIQVLSELGQGATFCFTLEVSEQQEKPAKQKNTDTLKNVKIDQQLSWNSVHQYADQTPSNKNDYQTSLIDTREIISMSGPTGITVLVVDDEPINLKVIKDNLLLAGMEVQTSSTGLAALEILKQQKTDIILLDVMMPRMNGFEVARKIRKQYNKEELPIIFVTAKNQVRDLMDGFIAGGNDYIPKPISKNELIARINFHMDLKNSRNKIKASEEKYRNILKSIEEGYYECDLSGNYTFANESFYKMIGYSDKEVLGMNYKKLVDEKTSKDVYLTYSKVYQTGKPIKGGYEFEVIRKDGSKMICDISVTLRRDSNGKPVGFQGALRDITNRKQKEKAEKEREIAEATSKAKAEFLSHEDGYYEVDLEGNFIFSNASLTKRFGYDQHEFPGMNYREHMDEKNAKIIFNAFNNVYRTGKNLKAIEWEAIRKDGSRLICETSVSLMKDTNGKPVGFRGINRDISEKKEADKLRTAKEVAEKAEKVKSELLANMSHEIRTPMTAIIGFSDLALQCGNANKQSDYLNKIRSASVFLQGVIDDILDYSRIESKKLKIEKIYFNLDNILADISDIFASKAIEKKLKMIITIDSNVPKNLIGDPLRLKQVLINLIGNAFKFTKDGQITIKIDHISKINRDANNLAILRFLIQDSGVGMTDEQTRMLFKPFSQGDSSISRKYGGTGLGLAISKELVEMMGGDIRVDSKYGKGSTFCFTAKFRLQEQSEDKYQLPDDDLEKAFALEGIDNIRGAEILLVEDNKFIQQVALEMLENNGFKVTLAGDGETAIHYIYDNIRFDAVLMDIQMAEMDGYEVTHAIRKDSRFKKLPIIAMTAHTMVEEKKKCLDAGMNDHVSKPIDPISLFKALIKWIPPLDHPMINLPQQTDEENMGIELPKHLPGLNINSGLKIMSGKKKTYIKILKNFRSRYTDFSSDLNTAHKENRINAVQKLIHTLKGVSGTIGADNLHGISKDIDKCIKTGRIDELDMKLFMLNKSLQTVLESIRQLDDSDISEAPPVKTEKNAISNVDGDIDIDKIVSILTEMNELLSQGGTGEALSLLDAVNNDLIILGFEQHLKNLIEEIEAYKDEEAMERLAALKDTLKNGWSSNNG